MEKRDMYSPYSPGNLWYSRIINSEFLADLTMALHPKQNNGYPALLTNGSLLSRMSRKKQGFFK